MSFNEKYLNIKKIAQKDFDIFENEIEKLFSGETPLDEKLLQFICAPSKRLRPLLGFLFTNCVFNEMNNKQLQALLAIELIHNATLIHDDVIDDSKTRRSQKTFNSEFSSDLAVVAGDFLLSTALEKIMLCESFSVLNLFTDALKKTCKGEINQYFSKFEVPTIEKYIEKSRQKSALLFETALESSVILSDKNTDENLQKIAKDFAKNFGIAFQIRDDLINILETDSLKPSQNDWQSGIYTAPVIFAYQQDKEILKKENLPELLKSSCAIEKTKNLIDNYFTKAISALAEIQNNKYKEALIDLINLLNKEL